MEIFMNIQFRTRFTYNRIISVLVKILQVNSLFVGGTRQKMANFNLSALQCRCQWLIKTVVDVSILFFCLSPTIERALRFLQRPSNIFYVYIFSKLELLSQQTQHILIISMYSLYSGRNTKYSVILTFCKIETYMPKEFSFHFQVYQVSCVLIWIKNPRSSLHVLKSLSAMAMELGGKTTPRSLKTTIRCTQGHVTFLQTYIIILVISYISQVSRYLIFSILR